MSPVMDEYQSARVATFLESIKAKVTRGGRLSSKDYERIICFACDHSSIVLPPRDIYRFFLFPPVAAFVAHELARTLNSEQFELYKDLGYKLHHRDRGPFIQLRELHTSGEYPNFHLARGNCYYLISQGYPHLITYNAGPGSFPVSEVAWATKNELRFAVSVSCASEAHFHHFAFGYPLGVSLPYSYYKPIPVRLRQRFMVEWARLHDAFEPPRQLFTRAAKPDFTSFRYSDFSDAQPHFNRLFDIIRLSDDLLLRTAGYYVKSTMLWMNPVFGEEATAYVLFALEGCLLLLQRKEGSQCSKIDLDLLRRIFQRHFPGGADFFDSIREAYDTRIALVHASPKWGVEWAPFVAADDFFGYQNAVKYFLNSVLIDRLLED